MNLELDLGRPTMHLDLAGTVPVSRPGKQNVLEFHFSEIFKMNSSLMMHCYVIIPFNGNL